MEKKLKIKQNNNFDKISSKLYVVIGILIASSFSIYNYYSINYIAKYKLLIEPNYVNNFSVANATRTSFKNKEQELIQIVNNFLELYPKKIFKKLKTLQEETYAFKFDTSDLYRDEKGITVTLQTIGESEGVAKKKLNDIVYILKQYVKNESDIVFRSFVLREIERRIESTVFHLKFLEDKREEYSDQSISSFITQKILNLTEARYFSEQMKLDLQGDDFVILDVTTLQNVSITKTKTLASVLVIFFTTFFSTVIFLYLMRNRKTIIKSLQFN